MTKPARSIDVILPTRAGETADVRQGRPFFMQTSVSSFLARSSTEQDDGVAASRRSVVRHASWFTDVTHHDADSDHQTLSEAPMSNSHRIPNVRDLEPYRLKREVERALRYVAREAVSDAPVKVVAIEAGISPREVTHLRTATRNPHLSTWYAILQRRPDLKPYVDQITSGEATSEQISKLIAFFRQGE